jgi:hypothetical protein
MWWSYSDGSTWSGQFQLADRRSDYGPSLATDDLGHVVMAWRGPAPTTTSDGPA